MIQLLAIFGFALLEMGQSYVWPNACKKNRERLWKNQPVINNNKQLAQLL